MISYIYIVLSVSCFALGFLVRMGIDRWAEDREAPLKKDLKASQEAVVGLRINEAYYAGQASYRMAYDAPIPEGYQDNMVCFPETQAR